MLSDFGQYFCVCLLCFVVCIYRCVCSCVCSCGGQRLTWDVFLYCCYCCHMGSELLESTCLHLPPCCANIICDTIKGVCMCYQMWVLVIQTPVLKLAHQALFSSPNLSGMFLKILSPLHGSAEQNCTLLGSLNELEPRACLF